MGRLKRIFLLVFPVLSVVGAGAQDLETFVRKNYLVPDPEYEFAPAHRYKVLGKVDTRALVKRPEEAATYTLDHLFLADGLFTVRYDFENEKLETQKLDQTKDRWVQRFYGLVMGALGPENKDIARGIVFDELVSTKKGDFVFCSFEKLKTSSGDLKREDLDAPRSFWRGFGLIRGRACLLSEVKITEEDPETGGYSLALWDVFTFKERECILIYAEVFEAHNFEVFEVTPDGLKCVLEFNFGGL